jgi:hypothetical protein
MPEIVEVKEVAIKKDIIPIISSEKVEESEEWNVVASKSKKVWIFNFINVKNIISMPHFEILLVVFSKHGLLIESVWVVAPTEGSPIFISERPQPIIRRPYKSMILILVPKFGLLINHLHSWLSLFTLLLLLLVPHLHLYVLDPLLVLQFDLLWVDAGARHSGHLAEAH